MMSLGEKCEPLWLHLKDELLRQDITHVDETTYQVLKEAGRKAETDSWLWQYRSAQGEARPVVLFEYQQTRSGEHPRNFFSDSATDRYIHVDGYAGYNKVEKAKRVGCWAHVRRKFFEANEAIPIDSRPGTIANGVLGLINELYGIERRIRALSPEERFQARLTDSQPLIHQILDVLKREKDQVVPNSLVGKAINYALGQWEYLTVFLEDPRLSIDNNISEREIKGVVMGRKNWLFSDSERGAKSLAIMYSLVRTALANRIRPYLYLRHIFTELPKMERADQVTALLPWNLSAEFPRLS